LGVKQDCLVYYGGVSDGFCGKEPTTDRVRAAPPCSAGGGRLVPNGPRRAGGDDLSGDRQVRTWRERTQLADRPETRRGAGRDPRRLPGRRPAREETEEEVTEPTMTLAEYMNETGMFPLSSQRGLTPEQQMMIDAVNYDDLVPDVARGIPVPNELQAVWAELK